MKTNKMFGILVIFLLLVAIPSASAAVETINISSIDTVAKDGVLITQTIQKVTVKTDKYIYTLRQPVRITVKNGPYSQMINFDDIMVKNTRTGEIFSVFGSFDFCSPNIVCVLVSVAPYTPVSLGAGQTYTITWYPQAKGTYKTYVDWWTYGTVACMAIGCPEPEPALDGRTYSNSFLVR